MAMAQALLRRSYALALAGRVNVPRYYQAAAASNNQPHLQFAAATTTSSAVFWTKGTLVPRVFGVSSGCGKDGQISVRYMATASDGGLLKILKSEIDYEAKQDKPKEVENVPPKPFTLQDKPGTQEIILRRSFGSEEIAITCVFQTDPYANQPEDEDEEGENQDEEDEGATESVGMTVAITKGGEKPALEISCVTSGDGISIERVAYLEEDSDKELFYEGPEFDELDEDLQKQFENFLETRGINEELGQFLMQYMPEKERLEYVRWLKNVEAFVKL